MDKTKKTVDEIKERVQSFIRQTPYRDSPSGTAGPKPKPINSTLNNGKESYGEKCDEHDSDTGSN